MGVCSHGEYLMCEREVGRSHIKHWFLKDSDGNKEMKKAKKIEAFSWSQFNLSGIS